MNSNITEKHCIERYLYNGMIDCAINVISLEKSIDDLKHWESVITLKDIKDNPIFDDGKENLFIDLVQSLKSRIYKFDELKIQMTLDVFDYFKSIGCNPAFTFEGNNALSILYESPNKEIDERIFQKLISFSDSDTFDITKTISKAAWSGHVEDVKLYANKINDNDLANWYISVSLLSKYHNIKHNNSPEGNLDDITSDFKKYVSNIHKITTPKEEKSLLLASMYSRNKEAFDFLLLRDDVDVNERHYQTGKPIILEHVPNVDYLKSLLNANVDLAVKFNGSESVLKHWYDKVDMYNRGRTGDIPKVFKSLLKICDPNIKDKNDETIVDLLIKKGEAVYLKNLYSRYDFSGENGHRAYKSILKLITDGLGGKRGITQSLAKKSISIFNEVKNHGARLHGTDLSSFIQHSRKEEFEDWDKNFIKDLAENYTDELDKVKVHKSMNTKGWESANNTALGTCCKFGYSSIANVLLEKGADPNAENSIGLKSHALFQSCQSYSYSCLKHLIKAGVNTKALTYEGESPLHVLFKKRFYRSNQWNRVKSNIVSSAKLLLDNGVDYEKLDDNGNTWYDKVSPEIQDAVNEVKSYYSYTILSDIKPLSIKKKSHGRL